nr:MAG TPA: hypothetical protein [Caudoviricetes sp.]
MSATGSFHFGKYHKKSGELLNPAFTTKHFLNANLI